jgi:flagellar export protein FliJ
MKKTQSRLATLLRVRELELARAGTSYGHAARGLATLGARARERAHRAARGRASLVRCARAGESAVVLRTAVAGVRLLGNASLDAERQVERARATTQQAHALLLAARTRVRALERVRDRLAEEERAGHQRAEQRVLDEIGLHRVGPGRREP